MAYEAEDAERIQRAVEARAAGRDVTTKGMFGGIAFFVDGNMAVGIYQAALLVRVDPAQHDAVVGKPHARGMVQRGREMRGWIQVEPAGWADAKGLGEWVARGVAYAGALPPKGGGAKKGSPKRAATPAKAKARAKAKAKAKAKARR